MKIAPKVWKNGEFINWDDARVHVMTHAINYGSSVFEGIRCYNTTKGSAVFRLTEHMQRLLNSAKIYRMDTKFKRSELCDAAVGLIRQSGLDECYLRPLIFRGLDEAKPAFGVNPFGNPIDTYVCAWQWGKYLGEEALENGIDVCVSSWTRITSNSMPAMAKAGANYMNSQLIKMEAILGGFSEGIALDDRGYVSEGSGENIFLVNNGKLITPPLGASILPGITRDSVIEITREMGIEVLETSIQRSALYLADEVFFTGTAAEITPIRSVDRITVGSGKCGEITRKLQTEFFKIIHAERPAPANAAWLTFVDGETEKKTIAAK
ncbi:MAG: branched-chain amino acid transaminase [Pyrinomonadaceae bacterium]